MVKQTICPEATSMKNYFLALLMNLSEQRIIDQNFLSSLRIIEEPFAKNTFENALFSKIILENLIGKINRITILTSEFHMKRSKLLFETIFEGFEIKSVESKTEFDEETMEKRVKGENERIENMKNYLKEKGF